MPYNNNNDRNQSKNGCDRENGAVYDKKKKHKSKNLPPLRKYDHDIFNCPFMQTPEQDKVQYLYADPCFIRQATRRRQRAGYNNEVEDEDMFYDCEGDSLSDLQTNQQLHNIADVIENIQDPREFKCLLKEVANTSQILYRCFRRAYHKAKKSTTCPEGVSKKYGKCEKCLRRCREKSQKDTGKKPCDEIRTCDYPHQEPGDPQVLVSKDLLECDKIDCDCPKEHKVGEQISDNDKHENKECDCLENRQGLIKDTKGPNSNLCSNALGSVVNLNGFDVYKICPSCDIEYKDMGFCERCARLRGEPLAADQIVNKISKETVPLKAISSNFVGIKNSTVGGAEIIRCPEISPDRSNPLETQMIPSGMPPKSKEIVVETAKVIMSSQKVITTNFKTPTVNEKQCEELQQFPTNCCFPQNQYDLNVDVTTNSSRCPCYRHPTQVSANNPYCQSPSNQPYPLCTTFQAQRPCPCHRNQCSHCVPTKHTPTSRCRHGKSSRRSNNVHMQPIAFTLPINLQIQTRSGETRFFQTEVQMEATAESGKRKPKPKSYAAEPIRTATIAATAPASHTQTENVFRFQQLPELAESNEVFYSCSSSTCSVVETISSHPDKPCEALLEIFEIIKKRVSNNKDIPSHILKELTAFDINECFSNKSTSPIPESILSSELKSLSESSETARTVGTGEAKTIANLETQTEPLVTEVSSPRALARVSTLSQYIEESLSKPKPSTGEPLLYYQGSGCFDLPLTNRPRHQPPTDLLQEVINDLEQKSKTASKPILIEPLSDDIIHKLNDMQTEDSTQAEIPTLVAPITEEVDEAIAKESAKVKSPEHPTSTTSILPATPPTPPLPPPLPRTPALAARISNVAQTDILSSSVYSHLKRNDMRKEITDNLKELVKPASSNTKNKYDPDEKDEVLRDLHKLFTPKRAGGQVPKDESRDSVLDDIHLLLNPRETRKTVSSSTISTIRHKSKSNLRKSRSTEAILKDIRYVLNPKGGEKTTKRFSRDHRELVLEHMHSLLTPRNQRNTKVGTETRDSVLQDLRYILDTPKPDNTKSLNKPPKPPAKPKRHSEASNLKSSSDDVRVLENNQYNKSEILDKPKSPSLKKDLQLLLPSSSEDITATAETNRPHTSRQAPPTPKKPKPKTSRPVDENDSKTHKVDNSQLIPSSQVRNQSDRIVTTHIDDGISLVSTSSDTFFINLDDNLSDAYPPRPSSFLRRSQYYADSDEEESSYDHELRNDKLRLDKKRESKEYLQPGNRHQAGLQDVTPKLNVNIGQTFTKPSLPETSTNAYHSQNRYPLMLSPSMNLESRHQSVRIDAKEDFKPFNRKYEKRFKSERKSVIAGDKRKSKSLENNKENVRGPGSVCKEKCSKHKVDESDVLKKQDSHSKKKKSLLQSIENL